MCTIAQMLLPTCSLTPQLASLLPPSLPPSIHPSIAPFSPACNVLACSLPPPPPPRIICRMIAPPNPLTHHTPTPY